MSFLGGPDPGPPQLEPATWRGGPKRPSLENHVVGDLDPDRTRRAGWVGTQEKGRRNRDSGPPKDLFRLNNNEIIVQLSEKFLYWEIFWFPR